MAEEVNKKSADRALITTGIVVALIVIALLTNGFGLFNKDKPPIDTSYIPLNIENSPVLGNPEANVTIYEFSDFACPYCQAAVGKNEEVIELLRKKDPSWEAPIPEIIRMYVDTGKVKLVFKYYPGHGGATTAHQVALALNKQNLFWRFSDEAFANPESITNLNSAKEIAKSIGADMEKLESDLEASNFFKYDLERETRMGLTNGVQGTPAFFINGRPITGAQSFSAFKKIIDEELARN